MEIPSEAVSSTKTSPGPYNRLVIAHQDSLFSLAYWLLGEETAASEAVEAALLKAYRQVDRLRTPVQIWLYRYIIQACQEMFRLTKKTENPPENEEVSLHSRLGRLPSDLRLAAVLVDVMGLDYNQAAAALNTSRRVVARRVARARKTLT